MGLWNKSWWVVLFCVAVGLIHFHFMKEKKSALYLLNSRLEEMEQEKWAALQKREELLLCIGSQNDPAWIEMLLMRDLGVVPEGFLKVHFKR